MATDSLTARLHGTLGFLSQVNEVQASLFVTRKLEELGAVVDASSPEYTRFILAALRMDIRDFHSSTPCVHHPMHEFHSIFDWVAAKCNPPLPQTRAVRLLCTIQFILLPARRWVDEYNDESLSAGPFVLFDRYSTHLAPYLPNPIDPSNAVQREAKDFQRRLDEFLVDRKGPLVHEKLVALLARFPLVAFQVHAIRFLNAVEDQLFSTTDDTVVAFDSTTAQPRVSRRSLQRPMEVPAETWTVLDKCLSAAVQTKFPRPDDQSILDATRIQMPPPPAQVRQDAHSQQVQQGAVKTGRQNDEAAMADGKREKDDDNDDVVTVSSPESVAEDKKWPPGAGDATQQRRRKRRVVWTPEEEDAVRQGVRVFGESSWTEIKRRYPNVLVHRTAEQIKDKFRNIQKRLSKGSAT
ncbi:hypothetical protein H310_07602 [Aphanomyces invadans]|uniref:Uncharacterized protein n=1 Tax=Aphanomyces invadans TaxID=157072 RepID=A0A024U1V5_9STRA|nr:hypothetical protein H310_07602 [Aphanomyces invadans]ETW00205.1 hypothetical protein H310_07602 [Aphanomyces invadans]|eukprot:XP_008871230.1 hypothetical protein H310_07602 [Aphanomyces invadans]